MWIICASLITACLIIVDTIRLGISPMPTTKNARVAMLKMLPEKVEGTIYDLGCGFGFLALRIAKKYPNATVIGYEKALVPFLVSKFLSSFIKNFSVRYVDFTQTDLTKADLLITYLFPGAMKRLSKKKIKGELFSNTFRLPGHEPVESRVLSDLYKTEIFHYSFK